MTSDSLAAWLAGQLGATRLIFLKRRLRPASDACAIWSRRAWSTRSCRAFSPRPERRPGSAGRDDLAQLAGALLRADIGRARVAVA